MPDVNTSERLNVGGQAVIEGVMMRSPRSFAVVCRRPDKSIVIKEAEWKPLWAGFKALRWPVLRGSVVLLESLVNGLSALTFSADQQLAQEGAEQPGPEASTGAGRKPGSADSGREQRPMRSLGARAADQSEEPAKAATYGMVALSLIFALMLFVGAPHLAAWALGGVFAFDTSSLWFHAVDGAIKLAVLVGYLAAISLLPDIRRVFQYHGAEHKAIFTYEAGEPLTVANAAKHSRFHPRCGTSFLLLVIMVSVVIFSIALRYPLAEQAALDHLIKILVKIPLMFPVAGLAYELIRLAGKNWQRSFAARIGSAPGLWLQHITTREPDDEQLEIALISIRKTLWRERLAPNAAPIGTHGVEIYASADEIDLPLGAHDLGVVTS